MEGETGVRIDETHADRDRVQDRADGEPGCGRPQRRARKARLEQTAATRAVQPDRGPRVPVDRHRRAVRHCRNPRALPASQGFAQDAGRIRDEHDREEQEEVEIEEASVDALEAAEDRVMVQPHDPDDAEAHDVSRDRRPPFGELAAELVVVAGLGNREHQEGDGDGEDAVAQGLHPALAQLSTSHAPVGSGGSGTPSFARGGVPGRDIMEPVGRVAQRWARQATVRWTVGVRILVRHRRLPKLVEQIEKVAVARHGGRRYMRS